LFSLLCFPDRPGYRFHSSLFSQLFTRLVPLRFFLCHSVTSPNFIPLPLFDKKSRHLAPALFLFFFAGRPFLGLSLSPSNIRSFFSFSRPASTTPRWPRFGLPPLPQKKPILGHFPDIRLDWLGTLFFFVSKPQPLLFPPIGLHRDL